MSDYSRTDRIVMERRPVTVQICTTNAGRNSSLEEVPLQYVHYWTQWIIKRRPVKIVRWTPDAMIIHRNMSRRCFQYYTRRHKKNSTKDSTNRAVPPREHTIYKNVSLTTQDRQLIIHPFTFYVYTTEQEKPKPWMKTTNTILPYTRTRRKLESIPYVRVRIIQLLWCPTKHGREFSPSQSFRINVCA